MVLFSATATTNGKANQTWCICRQCVDGFGIPVEFDGEKYRVCGELCAVGQPMSNIDLLSVSTTSTASTLAAKVAAPSPLVCNICRLEVDLSSSLSKPCVSDDDDDDDMISSNN